jgi:mono/diheme cytochrome c family protein
MIQSPKVRRPSSSLGARSRSLVLTPFTGAIVAALSLGAVSCGGDDDDVSAARSADGGTSGSGGKGGSSGKGGTAGQGGSGGGGGTAGTNATGGKATVIPPGEYDGQDVFRFDTFGDEQFWTGTLRMHEAIQAALDPMTALSLGLKVDAEVLPEGILEEVDLEDPATTVALIAMNAVVGVQGTVDADMNLTSVGITCALCHSDVDDSVMEGIGVRIDGAANRDLDPGAIIALAPGLEGNTEALDVYNSWGPGFYDPRFNQDMINHPVVIPPIYGLADVPLETYTGDGPISYWNAYVGITQMGGIGNFFDPRIGVSIAYDRDMINPKLPALFEYQVSLEPAAPPDDAFDPDAAARGQELFEGAANCSSCHSGPRLTDAATTLHGPDETGMDATYAERTATKMYRTTPLRALLAHPPYFHDGSAATLADVVTHYDAQFELGLTAEEQADLVEYLNSL